MFLSHSHICFSQRAIRPDSTRFGKIRPVSTRPDSTRFSQIRIQQDSARSNQIQPFGQIQPDSAGFSQIRPDSARPHSAKFNTFNQIQPGHIQPANQFHSATFQPNSAGFSQIQPEFNTFDQIQPDSAAAARPHSARSRSSAKCPFKSVGRADLSEVLVPGISAATP